MDAIRTRNGVRESLSVEQFDETAVVCGVQRAQVRLPAGDQWKGARRSPTCSCVRQIAGG
jgi:hypothetical protein